MKTSGLKQIVGKTITGVVIKKHNSSPSGGPFFQIYLVFLDNTNFEMYTSSNQEEIFFGGYVDVGGFAEVRQHAAGYMTLLYEAFLDDNGQLTEKSYHYDLNPIYIPFLCGISGNTAGLSQMLGKTITAVVAKQTNCKRNLGPAFQLKLVFLDKTNFEFYSPSCDFGFVGGVDPGGMEEVRRFMEERLDIIFEAHIDPNSQPTTA